jgi:tRNA(fMet)-specific endonuclease VapC
VRYLLDTNICIFLMREQPASVADRFARLRTGDVGMSAVTLAELRYGVMASPSDRRRRERALEALLRAIPAVPFDASAAAAYGVLRAQRPERQRNTLDRLIAAHALALGATLVTNNERDFAGYDGLVVENWVG